LGIITPFADGLDGDNLSCAHLRDVRGKRWLEWFTWSSESFPAPERASIKDLQSSSSTRVEGFESAEKVPDEERERNPD
jgi:hypothetical protein